MNSPAWAAQFEEFVEAVREEHKIPGLSVAFARDGEVVYTAGFGLRDREAELPAEPDTVYGIGSVTKSFTAMAVMQLQDQGKLSVHDPVVDYLPEFGVPDEELSNKITIHHFLTHLSSLPPQPTLGFALKPTMEDHPEFDPEADKPEEPDEDSPPMETYEQIMEYLRESDYDLLGDLEEFFSYSNDAYALLGTIIERVSGLDYAEYVEEHILQPAEMDRSTFSLDELDKWNNVTEIYFKNKNEEVVDVPQWPDSHSFCAAGFLRSTVLDLLKYGEIYLGKGKINGERVLSPEAVEDMAEPACHLYDNLHYGYGLMIQPDYEGVTLVEHGGSITGVAAQFGYVPEEGLAGAVLTNLAGVPSNKIWLAGINAMMGLPLEHRRAQYPDYELAPEQLERFTGTYRSGEGTTLNISLEDDQLTAEFGGLEASLRPTAENTLVVEYRGDERPVTFFASGEEDGEFDAAFFGLRVVHRVDEEELEDSE